MVRDDIEARVRRLTNKDEDAVLVHRPPRCMDHERHHQPPGLFTDDSTVDYGPVVYGWPAFGAVLGLSGQFAATRQSRENVLAGFELEVSVRSSVFTWHETRYGAVPRIPGCDQDRVQRTPRRWGIAHHQLRISTRRQDFDVEWPPLAAPVSESP